MGWRGKLRLGCSAELNFNDCKLIKNMGPRGFPGGAVVENPPANAGNAVRALVWEDPTCRGATGPVSHNY